MRLDLGLGLPRRWFLKQLKEKKAYALGRLAPEVRPQEGIQTLGQLAKAEDAAVGDIPELLAFAGRVVSQEGQDEGQGVKGLRNTQS